MSSFLRQPVALGVALATLSLVSACEPALPLVCHDGKEGAVDINPSYWRIDPTKEQEKTFVITGTTKDGGGWESLSVDVTVRSSLDFDDQSAALGSEDDYFVLWLAPESTCDQLSSQLLRCLLSPSGQASFKLTTKPSPKFPAFELSVVPTLPCSDEPHSRLPVTNVVVDSGWSNLQIVEYPEYSVATQALACGGDAPVDCKQLLRARPVELRFRDGLDLPIELGDMAKLTWQILVNPAQGTGKLWLARQPDCGDVLDSASLALAPLVGGKLAISERVHVCADGPSASVELLASAVLTAPLRGSTMPHAERFTAQPVMVGFDAMLERVVQLGAAPISDPPGAIDFVVRANGCGGTPLVGQGLDFSSEQISFPIPDAMAWSSDDAGRVSVHGEAITPGPYVVTVTAADGRGCDLELSTAP